MSFQKLSTIERWYFPHVNLKWVPLILRLYSLALKSPTLGNTPIALACTIPPLRQCIPDSIHSLGEEVLPQISPKFLTAHLNLCMASAMGKHFLLSTLFMLREVLAYIWQLSFWVAAYPQSENYLKSNRIMVTGPEVFPTDSSVARPFSFPKRRFSVAPSLMGFSIYWSWKFPWTYFTNSIPSKRFAQRATQSILGKLIFLANTIPLFLPPPTYL